MKSLEKIREDIKKGTNENPISYMTSRISIGTLSGLGLGLIIGVTSTACLMSQNHNPLQTNYNEVRTSDTLPHNPLPKNLSSQDAHYNNPEIYKN